MSDASKKPQIPNSIVDLLVSDIFKKNGINLDSAKERLSDEQKQKIKELVSDLTKQVDSFVNPEVPKKKTDPK